MATSGENRWPPVGRTDGRTWGETDGPSHQQRVAPRKGVASALLCFRHKHLAARQPSLQRADTGALRQPAPPGLRAPDQKAPFPRVAGRALAFDVGFPLSGSRTGLTPPISTSVPGTPPARPSGLASVEPRARQLPDGAQESSRATVRTTVIGVPSPARDAIGRLLHADTRWDYDDRVTCCDVGWLSHVRGGATANGRAQLRVSGGALRDARLNR